MFRLRKGKEIFLFELVIAKTRDLSERTCDLIILFGGVNLLRRRHINRTLPCIFLLMQDGGLVNNQLNFFISSTLFSKN